MVSILNLKSLKEIHVTSGNVPEKLLMDEMSRHGIRFKYQYIVPPYIIDFYFPDLSLAIELDGKYHEHLPCQRYDSRRDDYLLGLGIQIVRFKSSDSAESIVKKISLFKKPYNTGTVSRMISLIRQSHYNKDGIDFRDVDFSKVRCRKQLAKEIKRLKGVLNG